MKNVIQFAVLLLLISCSQKAMHNLNSTLWVQTAAEYQSICRQTYNTAIPNIVPAMSDNRWTGALEQTNDYFDLPPAVILDFDETVFNTAAYQAELLLTNSDFQISSWDQWMRKCQAAPVAGAVDFIHYLQNKGIEVIFISNRECQNRDGNADPCPQESDTIQNLKKIGITGITKNNILLKNEYRDWGPEKKSRRQYIAEKYRILMIFGDDLGDFISGVKKGVTPEKRKELAKIYRANWGSKWFILPNPMYGSWQKILNPPQYKYLNTISSQKSR